MPQAVLVVVAGMGLYAGLRWLAKEVRRHSEEVGRVAEEVRCRAAAAAPSPKDLGSLEYDTETQVYRPKAPRTC